MINSTIHASNVNHLEISCYGGHGEYTCIDSLFYLSSIHTIMNCEGYGCSNISLYLGDVCDKQRQIIVNGCDKCSSVKECNNEWSIHCNDDKQSLLSPIDDAFINDIDLCHLPTNAPSQSPTVFHMDPNYDMFDNTIMATISTLTHCIYFVSITLILGNILAASDSARN